MNSTKPNVWPWFAWEVSTARLVERFSQPPQIVMRLCRLMCGKPLAFRANFF
jgi:hypothetical protein